MTDKAEILAQLERVVAARRGMDPKDSYVASLFARGQEKVAQKFGEEAIETIIAAIAGKREEVIAESADMLFHWLILLAESGVSLEEIWDELARREGVSGHVEKAGRAAGSNEHS